MWLVSMSGCDVYGRCVRVVCVVGVCGGCELIHTPSHSHRHSPTRAPTPPESFHPSLHHHGLIRFANFGSKVVLVFSDHVDSSPMMISDFPLPFIPIITLPWTSKFNQVSECVTRDFCGMCVCDTPAPVTCQRQASQPLLASIHALAFAASSMACKLDAQLPECRR